jgi:hypothetical protein
VRILLDRPNAESMERRSRAQILLEASAAIDAYGKQPEEYLAPKLERAFVYDKLDAVGDVLVFGANLIRQNWCTIEHERKESDWVDVSIGM